MTRKKRTPEENARREKIRELLQLANIGSMEDIQSLFKETIAEFMENGLESELDDELGYSKYDYKNKDTDNSRNGHSSKSLRTSFGEVEVSVPRDRKGEFEPKLLKKNQTSISQDIEEKILSMYAKGMTTSDIEAHIQDTDTVAYQVIGILRKMGLRVPEDVQVIGFDGIRMFGDLDYICSTIVQPVADIAEACVSMVLSPDFKGLPSLIGLPVAYADGGTTLPAK